MYLKRIEMRGFKTFADRTELEFGPGITAVVGPNGVGKSNISDAILWALGEQSNRSLRTETAADIIFAGAEGRRPLGMAEVSLVVDNSDSALPIDYSEVVVSRRLFRSGDSEYLLNRNTARLRDITDLFLDTGIGPKAYSVVGQGEIDAILSIRSEDRRELLEEVAGIRKYRMRRNEATRKLDGTEANITRLADIVAELASQREPLEREAEVARQYNDLADRLHELEYHLLAGDYQRRRRRMGKLANELQITRADLQGTRNRISQLDSEHERTQFDLAKLGDDVDRLRDSAADAERRLDQARQAHALLEERIRAAVTRQQDLATVLENRESQSEDLAEQLANTTTEHASLADQLRAADGERARLESTLRAKSEEFEAKSQRLAELQRSRSELAERATALENEALALQSLEADLTERTERLSTQSEALVAREQSIKESLSAAEAKRTELADALGEKRGRLKDLRASLTDAARVLQEHRQKCNILAGAVTGMEARQELLRELARSREGFSDGARAAMRAAGEGHIQGVVGILAELLDVPARYERAIEAALGDALHWVVTETEDQAAEAARFLQQSSQGRATFVPLSGSTTSVQPVAAQSAAPSGALAPALKVARFKREHAPLFTRLLGDTIIVEDLEAAVAVRPLLRTRATLVTLNGEIIDAHGAVTAGDEEAGGTQAFTRRRELDALEEDLRIMRTSLADMWRREENLDRWCAKLTDDIHAIEAELSDLGTAHATADSDAAHLADQQRAARQTSVELSEETEGLGVRLGQAADRRSTAETEGGNSRQAANRMGEQIETVRASGVAQDELEAHRAQHVKAQVRSAELAEKVRSLEHLKERLASDLERAREEMTSAQEGMKASRESEAALREELAGPGDEGDIEALARVATDARAAVSKGAEALSELREKAAELETSRGRLNQVAQEQTDRIHRSELSIAREEAQLEHITDRLRDTYGKSPDEAAEERDEEIKEREVRAEANDIRERIRRLGPVNISAIDECDRMKAREDFLGGQLEDLETAKADLMQVIKEIDDAATSEFMDAFERMKVEFQHMFARLFGGGETELRLTNDDNPLEAGVDVIVQVPGKRQQNLLLLSGGERALTALALMFAMLRVKPTPFCVMDEIDAALDEANIGRFVEVLQDFAKESQFIIVTHNAYTIKSADVLFGVTMQDPGVSTLIRLELREWEEFLADAEEQVAAPGQPPRAMTKVLPTTT